MRLIVGGLGPMAGQAHHFRLNALEKLPYAIERYTDECNRLYGVMNRRLADREFLAGKYSIADIASVGWVSRRMSSFAVGGLAGKQLSVADEVGS